MNWYLEHDSECKVERRWQRCSLMAKEGKGKLKE